MGSEPALPFSAEELKHSTLIVRLQKRVSIWNNGKYIDIRYNDITIAQKIMNELLKLEYQLYIYSSSSMKHKPII